MWCRRINNWFIIKAERVGMLVYKAMDKFLEKEVHSEVLECPGVISWGPDLEQAQRLLASHGRNQPSNRKDIGQN